ncbi:MAG: FAD-dependent oxidoreductase [Anaerolineae bacterium]
MPEKVLVVGSGPSAARAALDLAEAGIAVHLVAGDAHLHANSIKPPCLAVPELLAATAHPLVDLWLSAGVKAIEEMDGGHRVQVYQHPHYVDLSRCTACGQCALACPVELSRGKAPTVTAQEDTSLTGNSTSGGWGPLNQRKAIYRGLAPTVFAIEKRGTAPCRYICPTHQRAQGYIALIRQRRFAEAYRTIKEDNPFPAICGRICNHRCEDACSRGRVDEPVNIMALKRFVADWAYAEGIEGIEGTEGAEGAAPSKRVAIVGAGPAGLTAAQDLVKLGHEVTVFEALPVAGGMLRVGVPQFRLPHQLIAWEVDQILAQGVELKLNHRVDDLQALFDAGYEAIFLATGAHRGKKLPIPGADLPDVLVSTDFLRRVSLGESVDLAGRRVLVIGGGNVAIDVARTALRLVRSSTSDQPETPDQSEVHMACLESRPQMPAHSWEIEAAEIEGVVIHPGRTIKEIISQDGRVTGVRCLEVDFRGFIDGRPDMDELEGTEHIIPADTVIFAIGQAPDLSYLTGCDGVKVTPWGTIEADPETMATAWPGVFAGSDAVSGVTRFAVDAIADGHRAARSIDRYLRGLPLDVPPTPLLPAAELKAEEVEARIAEGVAARRPRVEMPALPATDRSTNFLEVDLGLDEETAVAEAERCLNCGACSECLACEWVCAAGAINHTAQPRTVTLAVGAIIWADGRPPEALTNCVHLVGEGDAADGTAAAARLIRELSSPGNSPPSGGGLFSRSTLEPEREHPGQSPPLLHSRSSPVGVFLCRCGGEISGIVDFGQLRTRVLDGPQVAFVEEVDFACHAEGTAAIQASLSPTGVERAVLAACSCCTLDQICYSCSTQRLRCKTTLLQNPLNPPHPLFQFVNLREHCAFVHGNEHEAATAKAVELVAAGIARVLLAQPPLWVAAAGLPVSVGIDVSRCRGCGDCVQPCKFDAITLLEGSDGLLTAQVNSSSCCGCGACLAHCPTGAIGAAYMSDRMIRATMEALLA